MDLDEMVLKEIENGYGDKNAEAKVCQDIVLKAISKGPLKRNVTIKGGVVMRSITGNVRRATRDLDLDFIKYPLTDSAIDDFIRKLNVIEGISIKRAGEIEELKQQDYHGKRVYVDISDENGHTISSKIDLGVHNRLEIEQETFCFDIAFDDEGASLLINTQEQMLAEKLRSLLRFGAISTRYKDIYDMYYHCDHVDRAKLMECLNIYIFNDEKMRENSVADILKRVTRTFKDPVFKNSTDKSDRRWVDEDIDFIMNHILEFLKSL